MLKKVYEFYKETVDYDNWPYAYDLIASDQISKALRITFYSDSVTDSHVIVVRQVDDSGMERYFTDYIEALEIMSNIISWSECNKEDFEIAGFTVL